MKLRGAISVLGLGLCGLAPALADELTPEQRKATISWIQGLQKENGGFASDSRPDMAANLPATAAALRALKSFAAEPKDRAACEKFIASCYDADIAGFAAMPGKTGEQRTTGFGLMAVAHTKLPHDKYVMPSVIFLCSSVKKIEEIHLAAAAYEAVESKCELASDWVERIRKGQNGDGTYGKGPRIPVETATAVNTLLRLGGRVDHPEVVVKSLKAGQLGDGGWGPADAKSDLETTYRVVLALKMLKDHPAEPAACRRFVASCRNKDGSYGIRPGQMGSIHATAFAGAVLQALEASK